MNRRGQFINSEPYQRVFGRGYSSNGLALVETRQGLTAIDTTGKVVVGPRRINSEEIYYSDELKDVLLFRMPTQPGEFRWGFWDLLSNTLVPASFDAVDRERGFQQGLLKVFRKGRNEYVNRKGKVVWREGKAESRLFPMNIDYLNVGYFFAASTYKEQNAQVKNAGMRKLAPQVKASDFPPDTLMVEVRPSERQPFAEAQQGMAVYVANTKSDTLRFSTQDSRLNMKVQALDEEGHWRDIECLPGSWCGNSYYSMRLAPGQVWHFTTPVYEGSLKTKLRIELLYVDDVDNQRQHIFHSNEYEGSVNPGQFWRKPANYPMAWLFNQWEE